ncbi:AraC family transcriptional regulator [Flavivirga eckloniae]|uniref:AraC family transcriptional regulator n=1 Tax=Flavivirga eckloniae TaxID=1803846 RepID=A0A2K9PU64_9FLAO|nr:AraC family transcriptional regulator [Flavivirga eckloniae]AUP80610.1 AraC family transcriptional regulator [Flavivirga eckloniae]
MRKKDRFEGQKLLVLPKKVKKKLKKNSLTNYLYITDIGYFPNGKHHYRSRKNGSDEHILIFCVDGKGWIEIDGKKQHLSKNKYSIIPKQTPHTYAADPNTPWTIYWMHFLGDKAEAFVYPLDYPRELKETNVSRFKDRIELFEEIYFNLDAGYSDQNMEYSSILLMHLLGSFKYLSQFQKIKEIKQQDVVSKAIVFIKSNLHKKLSLSEIADYCSISVSHLCLLFKKKTAYSPIEYLIFMRMQKACSLLEFSNLKINIIANNVGYDDAFYFSRIFKTVIGKSPSQYRVSIYKAI